MSQTLTINDHDNQGWPRHPRKELRQMTLTNHTRRIEELSGDVVAFADKKEYGNAHIALDDIEAKVRKLHRHIDRLQNISLFAERPAGGD